MRNILLPIFGDDAGEARLAAAIGLARAFGGHIDCVQARSPSAYVMTDPIGGAYVLDAARRRLGEEEAAVRAAVERRLAGEATAWSFEHVDGDPLRVILARARLADVVVLSRVIARAGAEDPLPIASAVVTEGPAPVLAVPPQWELTAIRRGGFDCAGDAVVAWDGSIGAARALHAALPLLARAVDQGDDGEERRLPGDAGGGRDLSCPPWSRGERA